MNLIRMRRAAVAIATAGLFLGGCASKPASLYYWGDYQKQVYAGLRNEGSSPEQQIAALEKTVQEARSNGRPLPPGFHAQLGMLYLSIGKADQVQQEFETEKANFPESAPFMDFLLGKLRGEKK